MLNETTITLTGTVGTEPRKGQTNDGRPIVNFRLASNSRRYDRDKKEWVDGATSWYAISAFRQLAVNTLMSIQKGQHVVVTGRIRVKDWESGTKSGTTVEIDADAIGHNLAFGTCTFTRTSVGRESSTERSIDPSPQHSGEASTEQNVEGWHTAAIGVGGDANDGQLTEYAPSGDADTGDTAAASTRQSEDLTATPF